MLFRALSSRFVLACGIGALLAETAASQCPPWTNPFGVPGVTDVEPGDPTGVAALAWFDDGTGPALFVAGRFGGAGGQLAGSIARWDGVSWSNVDGGIGGVGTRFRALAVFDDGTGPKLYAGGEFLTIGGVAARYVARWDGASWAPLAAGLGGEVHALHVFDDGNGPALFAGGAFPGHVARWRNGAWTSPAGSTGGDVHAFATHVEGGVPRLFAGGEQGRVHRLVADTWTLFAQATTPWPGPPWPFPYTAVMSLASHGGELWVGGDFEEIGGQTIWNLARWNGASWSSAGGTTNVPAYVGAMTTLDLGNGPELIAATAIAGAGIGVFRWNGTGWSTIVTGVTVGALAPTSVGAPGGARLDFGGSFETVAGITANHVATWRPPATFTALGGSGAPDDQVRALAVHDDGTGPALYAGGYFTRVGDLPAQRVARWDGAAWNALGAGFPGFAVRALSSFDDGTGRKLYAGGSSTSGPFVTRWNGSAWETLPTGLNDEVYDLEAFDDGTGPALYATGRFWTTTTGAPARRVARWNGMTWSGVGDLSDAFMARGMAVFDDGTGPHLYVGAWRQSGNAVLRWDGVTWTQVGASLPGSVADLEPFDDGGGMALYATGALAEHPGALSNVRRWNGTSWLAVGSGIAGGAGNRLTTYRGQLVVGGLLGSVTGNLLAWNGSSWNALGGGVDDQVFALASWFDGAGAGPALYAGGNFVNAGGVASPRLARHDGCAPLADELCFGDGSGAACPCGNPSAPGSRAGCAHSFGSGGRVVASGNPSTSTDTLVLAGSGMTDAPTLWFQGTSALNGAHGVTFGDGLRCVGGTIVRLAIHVNVGGASQYPGVGDASISQRGGVTAGDVRFYQAYYRNSASFCTSAPFNLTNAVGVRWGP